MGTLVAEMAPKVNLRYGDFSVALYASNISFPVSSRGDAEILTYAWEGVKALGGMENVTQLHQRWVRLHEMLQRRQISEQDYVHAVSTIWNDRARLEDCIGCDLGRFLP
jgi:hypothetical protein